jgi:hypothetical protein
VAQFMQRRGQPFAIGYDVFQNANIARTIDVGAEGVRILARLLVQAAASEYVVDR